MVERKGTQGQLGHIVREGEGVFHIIVLVDNRWSGFGSAESRDRSEFDCGDALLVFVFPAIRRLNWRADVDDCGRLLGYTGTGDEAINDGLDLGSSCLTKVHLDISVQIIKTIVPVGCLGDTMYGPIFGKVEVGIGPFLAGLDRGGNSDHVGKNNRGARGRDNESLGVM